MIRFSIEPRTKNCVKGYRFLLVAINLSNKYEKKLLNTVTKAGLNAAQNTSKK